MTTTTAHPVGLSQHGELREVVLSSELPIATFDLDDMRVIDVNEAARMLIGLRDDAELPTRVADIVIRTEQEHAAASLRLLAQGSILAYEARRHLRRADGKTIAIHSWVRSLRDLSPHTALMVFAPYEAGGVDSFTGEFPSAGLQLTGPVVVGSLDLDMRVRRLGNDVVELLGEQPATMLGQPLVDRIHPDDVGVFLLGMGRSIADDDAAAMHVRIRHANGTYVRFRLVVTPTSADAGNTRVGIVLAPETTDKPRDARVTELERHLWRIALEVQAAGVVDGLQRLPDPSQVPGLGDLSPRQWDIATRLLRGERVPDIARANFVSQSTVRNQLAAIYQKVGVHSQTELLSLLRGGEAQHDEASPTR